MALTTRQIAFSNPSRATRQQIPPFLSKLYHMVNDPSTESLIRWSDSGDSFYVFDHERFAKEVLPHWFKHGNFGSFVRQLNNYGFHKVPHLQQGVLRSDGEAEISHFENQYFQRGQSDLLCLIQRKKQGHDAGEDLADANPPSSSSGQANKTEAEPPPALPTTPKGTVLDVNSILNGIQAIKRHQHAISAELKELHQSNQSLWQEAYAARERHKKHHDTITRILKFLAGVFGQSTNSPRAQEVPHDSSGDGNTIIQRRPNRLMIEAAGKKTGDTTSNGLKLNINDFMESLDFEGGQANDGERFATVETTGSRAASPTPTAKENTIMGDVQSPAPSAITSSKVIAKTPVPTPLTPTPHNNDNSSNSNNLFYSFPAINVNQNQLNSNDFGEYFSPHFTTPSTNPTTLNGNSTNNVNNSTALTCSTPPIPSAPTNEPNYLQSILNAIMRDPAQLQRVSAILQLPLPMTVPSEPNLINNEAIGTASSSLNTRAEISSPMIPDFRPVADNQFGSTIPLLDVPSNLGIVPHSVDNGSPNIPPKPQKPYRDARDVEADVNLIDGHIESLIECFGFDPAINAALRGEPTDEIVSSNTSPANGLAVPTSNAVTTAGTATAPSFPEGGNADFDFDSFLTQDYSTNGFGFGQGFELSPAAQTQGSEKIGAFLDEVQSVSNESDITAPDEVQQDKGRGVAGAGARKRRSDAADLEDSKGVTAPKTKKKR